MRKLLDAQRILISGIGGSALVAKDLSYKLQKLGLHAIADSDSHIQLANAATFNVGDVVVAISESGSTHEVTRVVKEARRHGSSVISITRYGKTPITQLADVSLYSVARASRPAYLHHARTAQNLVIDLLFIALIQASELGRDTLSRTNQAFARLRKG